MKREEERGAKQRRQKGEEEKRTKQRRREGKREWTINLHHREGKIEGSREVRECEIAESCHMKEETCDVTLNK